MIEIKIVIDLVTKEVHAEKTIYAFGLLEAIAEAGKIFPFIEHQVYIRKGINSIEKRHYEFTYNSPVNGKPLVIILDVLFETNNYAMLIAKIPDANSILGDKLTAFAPHTTGIRFGIGKELEIIKQLFDCCTLFRVMTSYEDVVKVYKKTAVTELGYRGMDIDIQTVLKDTLSGCFCIISKGGINKEEYVYFSDGIRKIGGHIYLGRFNGELAAYIASEVLYLATCIYTGSECLPIDNPDEYMNDAISFKRARKVNYLKRVRPQSHAYMVAAVRLLGDEIENLIE